MPWGLIRSQGGFSCSDPVQPWKLLRGAERGARLLLLRPRWEQPMFAAEISGTKGLSHMPAASLR